MKAKLAALYRKVRIPLLIALVLGLFVAKQVVENNTRYMLTAYGFGQPIQVLADHISQRDGFTCFRIIQLDLYDCVKSPIMELAPVDQESK